MSCWEVLGLDAEADERTIKRQYARLLKGTRPDEDPEAFQALREVLAVLRLQHVVQCGGAVHHQHEVVIAGLGKDGVDDVMADALIAEIDFEAVVEEGEEVECHCLG